MEEKGRKRGYPKCAMDCKTASSNSIGPGMSNVGWSAWCDILTSSSLAGFAGVMGLRWIGVYSTSSKGWADLSLEKGVLRGSGGRFSRCLEIRDNLACGGARLGEGMRGSLVPPRYKIWQVVGGMYRAEMEMEMEKSQFLC